MWMKGKCAREEPVWDSSAEQDDRKGCWEVALRWWWLCIVLLHVAHGSLRLHWQLDDMG